jgi:D-alanine-D-alanine ligase
VPEQRLRRVVVAFEPEAAAARRLGRYGYAPGIAREIATYLAQASDLPAHMDEIREALSVEGIAAEFIALDDVPAHLAEVDPEDTLVWTQTDGIKFYRGSAVPALARLTGFARYGSPVLAQHLCQDKFASLALAGAAGLAILPTLLLDGEETVGALGDVAAAAGQFFVKPATLGAKLGIWADSRCATFEDAKVISRRIAERYGDRALVQPFVEGDDVRVSVMDLGRPLAEQLGIFRLVQDEGSETGGAFMTMRDNATLSGARDTAGGRGLFGATREAAFVPRMMDLRRDPDPAARQAAATIEEGAARLARLVGLRDYFSMDFRVDAAGTPVFFEFEVCPAVTIYDFSEYLQAVHRLKLGPALARSMRLAFERRWDRAEA